MTGADSPVIADSSTLAMPSTTSPSPGMTWPASTTTRSPSCSSGAATSSSRPGAPGVQPTSRRAMVSVLALRSESACALPRPSATASARLANTTVSHSQTTISQANTRRVDDRQDGGADRADLDDEHDRVAPQRARVELAQRVRQRLPQHLRVEQAALHAACGALVFGCGAGSGIDCGAWSSVDPSASGPSARREEGERDEDQDDADEHADEQRPVGGQRAARRRRRCPAGPASRPGRARRRSAGTGRAASPGRARCCSSRC